MNSAAVALATFGQALIAAQHAAEQTLAQRVRVLLASADHSQAEMAAALPDADSRALRRAVDYLRGAGQASSVKRGQVVYSLTRAGRQAMAQAEAALPGGAGNVAQPRQVFGSGTYDGAELRHQVVRPGAYDAFALPSVHCGQRVARSR